MAQIILVDLDGTLADIDRGFYNAWREKHGKKYPAIPLKEMNAFFPKSQYIATYGEGVRELVDGIVYAPGFVENLPVIEGAVEGIDKLLSADYDVRFLSAPFGQEHPCAGEKYVWIENAFGKEFKKRLSITHDKSYFPGRFLIDDHNDAAKGTNTSWEQILYRREPYNTQSKIQKRMRWTDSDFLDLLK